jgi:hypothetical protein
MLVLRVILSYGAAGRSDQSYPFQKLPPFHIPRPRILLSSIALALGTSAALALSPDK